MWEEEHYWRDTKLLSKPNIRLLLLYNWHVDNCWGLISRERELVVGRGCYFVYACCLSLCEALIWKAKMGKPTKFFWQKIEIIGSKASEYVVYGLIIIMGCQVWRRRKSFFLDISKPKCLLWSKVANKIVGELAVCHRQRKCGFQKEMGWRLQEQMGWLLLLLTRRKEANMLSSGLLTIF